MVPIEEPARPIIRSKGTFFAPDVIPAETYKGIGAVKTLAVGAQWVTSDKADTNAVYEITRHCSATRRKTLGASHAREQLITKENAVKGAAFRSTPGLSATTRWA